MRRAGAQPARRTFVVRSPFIAVRWSLMVDRGDYGQRTTTNGERVSERFAVVIPALNAEKSVGDVVRACRDELPDVLVVDDGSSDRTGGAAAAEGATVLRHPRRRGKGAAMKSGFAWALAHGFDGVIG